MAIISVMVVGQPLAAATKGRKAMSHEQTQFVWNAAVEEFENRQQVYFMFSPGVGLTDIDFHPITERDWKAMRSPAPAAVARLEVVGDIPISLLEEVVRRIATKGAYRTVAVTVRQHN